MTRPHRFSPLALAGLLAFACCLSLATAPVARAQEGTADEQIALHRKKNTVRSLEGSIDALKKELQIRYAKEKTSRVYDKKEGKMTETQIVDRKQPILYDKATEVVIPAYEKAFKDETDWDAKIQKGKKLEAFLQRMKDLFGKDTEKLEKKIKKVNDPDALHDLIMAP